MKAAVFACLRVSTMVIPGAVLARQGLFEKESRRQEAQHYPFPGSVFARDSSVSDPACLLLAEP